MYLLWAPATLAITAINRKADLNMDPPRLNYSSVASNVMVAFRRREMGHVARAASACSLNCAAVMPGTRARTPARWLVNWLKTIPVCASTRRAAMERFLISMRR